MDVSDCQEAIDYVLKNMPELDKKNGQDKKRKRMAWRNKVTFFGSGFGGLIATHLAAKQQQQDHRHRHRHRGSKHLSSQPQPPPLPRLVLSGPLVDLVALRHLGPVLPNLLGRNYTRGQVEDEELLEEAWSR